MTGPGGDAAPTRIAKSMRGVYAAILGLEALTLLLVPRTVAQGGGLSGLELALTLALAVVLITLAGLQRRRWGFAAGSVAQVGFLAVGFVTVAMVVLGLLFGGIWVAAHRLQRDLLARTGGPPAPGG